VNRTVPQALQRLGYTPAEIERIVAHIEKYDTIEDVEETIAANASETDVKENTAAIRSGLKPRPPKPRNCPLDWGDSYELAPTGRALYTCHGDTAIDPTSRVLKYGTRWSRGGFTCASRKAGLRCSNRSGHVMASRRKGIKTDLCGRSCRTSIGQREWSPATL